RAAEYGIKGKIKRAAHSGPFYFYWERLVRLFFASLFAVAFEGQSLFHPHLLAWLHIIRMPLDFLNDVFLLHLALKTTQCIFKRFAFLNLYFCQKRLHLPTLRLDTL